MMKRLLSTMLLALVAIAGHGQSTKCATIKGYSPALKDGTVAISIIDNVTAAVDTVIGGHFTMTVPVDKLIPSNLYLNGEGCPNHLMTLYLKPDALVELTGTDCIFPLWKVDSPIPEQQTANRITEHNMDAYKDYFPLTIGEYHWGDIQHAFLKILKQTMDILPSLPIDAASLHELEAVALYSKSYEDFPYTQQLKELEAATAARAPKGFEQELMTIHALVNPPHVLQVGEEAVDAELFDMQGNKRHLAELFGKNGQYVLLDFWSLGCAPCIMSEPEMREVYERMKGKLEIVGINQDKLSSWQENNWSKKIVWKNWNDGKMCKGGVESLYCDELVVPHYVMISPDGRILWKVVGYGPGWFLGMAEVLNGLEQDNTANLNLVIKTVDATPKGTTISLRCYSQENSWFRIVKESYLEANGKKYQLVAADGIKLDENNYPEVNTFTAKEDYIGAINYTDFTLTFEPFDTKPNTFDFVEGDAKDAFVIRNISLK